MKRISYPDMVEARDKQLGVVWRSGSRSATSLKTDSRGWNEYDLPLVDMEGNKIDLEPGDRYFANKFLDYQRKPKS